MGCDESSVDAVSPVATMIARGREDLAYVQRQWLCCNGPLQTGRSKESRSVARGWLVNHLPRMNVARFSCTSSRI